MPKTDIQKLQKELNKELDTKRYEHTLGVAYTAACMAMRYDCDIQKAYIAGLLHDCAKCMTHEERLTYCKKHDIPVTEIEKQNPSLLHAKVGAGLCATKYGIEDSEIVNAIKYHTTGRPGMTLLEKIIFIADYLEPHRNEADDLPLVRKQVFEDMDLALRTILSDTLIYLQKGDKKIDPMTFQTYQYYTGEEK